MYDPILAGLLRVLPPPVREAVEALPPETQGRLEELRLRRGGEITAVFDGREEPLSPLRPLKAGAEELEYLLNAATGYSVYARSETIREGFVPLPGGHRVGLCGTAVMERGSIVTLRDVSSASVRVARQFRGSADEAYRALAGRPASFLLAGPPGSGKTTLLRDLVRQLSDRGGRRVGVVDSRGEIAACEGGTPQLSVGRHTDVISLCPKEQGVEILLRAMRPDYIAVDEITCAADAEAMLRAGGCGARLLATAHAFSGEELRRRPVYRRLLESGIFGLIGYLDSEKRLTLEGGEGLC